MRSSMRSRLLASSMITGLALTAGAAYAQTAPPPPTATSGGAPAVGEVVVTGSRIPSPNLTSVSPVQTVSGAVIKFQGVVNTVDVLDTLPQNSPSFGQFESNGATGTATVDLRGLGANRTLVLINGLRVGGQDPFEIASYVPDINFIPPSLIDRIDVLTGGASAVYGSDAVSGVVNFVMKTNFEGLQVDAQSSVFEYDGTDQQVRTAAGVGARNFGFPTPYWPKTPSWNGENYNVSVIGGANTGDGKGNVEFYLGYTEILAVLEGTRDYMTCGLSTNTSNTKQQYCGGSANNAHGLLETLSGPNAGNVYNITGTPVGGVLPPFGYGQAYNFAPLNFVQRPDQRYTAGEFSHYEVNNALDLYSSFMFMDDDSVGQIAPSGSFLGDVTFNIPCNDPLLSSAQANTLCGPYVPATATTPASGAGSTAVEQALIGRRDVEGQPRAQATEHLDFRMVFGARGDLGGGWHYDVSDEFSRSVLTESENGYFSNSKLANAIDVIPGPGGTAVCAVGPPCVPYNIWAPGGVTPAALNYLTEVANFNGSTQQNDILATLSNADLGPYGLKSPLAHDAFGVSLGSEYRVDELKTVYDQAYQSGDLAGFGGSFKNTEGSQHDIDVFGELRMPLIQDMPFAKDLSLEGGYRFSTYRYGGTSNTYKVGVDWQVVPDFRFRASYERAVRAPNVLELFEPDTPNLFAGQDPCAGTAPSLSAAQCYNTIKNTLAKNNIAMTETSFATNVYGTIPKCPAAQCGNFSGGNIGLKPEAADTYTVGFVLTPTFVHNLTVTVDYFDIVVNQAIINLPATTLLRNCAVLDSSFDCALIQRNASAGYAIFGGNGAGYVDTELVNGSKLSTNGVDVQADYRLRFDDIGLHNAGSLDFNLNGTYTATLTTILPDNTGYDCVGLYGLVCGIPTPKWRHSLRATWDSPWGLQLSANWRFIGPSSLDFNTSNPDLQDGAYKDYFPTDAHIGAYSYLDLSFRYRVNDRVAFRGGVNNVLDTTPPLLDSNSFGISSPPFGNGNTFPQLYDPLGRYFFIGLTADM